MLLLRFLSFHERSQTMEVIRQRPGLQNEQYILTLWCHCPISWDNPNQVCCSTGDAAHPMQPFLAQGACQGLEDAVCLADVLARYAGDVDRALIAYQETRIPRTARVQRTARLFGEICHIDGVGAMMRNALLAQRAYDDYTYVNWLYDCQP